MTDIEMTNEEAKKMLEAKLKCFIAETSGTNHDCNMRLCDGCALNYEQGNMGEQKQALDMAIKALEQQSSYNSVKSELEPCDDCISREDALKVIEEQKKGFYGVERYAIDECHSAVMKLPPVRPYREIVEDKRACEKCIHYVTRDSGRVAICGCDSWECDFEEVKT